LKKAFGKTPLYQREGGSIPVVVLLKELLGIDTVLLGFGLPDENAHAPDEHLNLENFFGGIRTSVHFFDEVPKLMS
jgi:acetylornithine deacetylase/succinyl-diaminopimelate desuccinylase-like protein